MLHPAVVICFERIDRIVPINDSSISVSRKDVYHIMVFSIVLINHVKRIVLYSNKSSTLNEAIVTEVPLTDFHYIQREMVIKNYFLNRRHYLPLIVVFSHWDKRVKDDI